MNIRVETIEKAIQALARHGLEVELKKLLPLGGTPARPDAFVQISRKAVELKFMAVVQRTVTTTTLGAVLAQVENATQGTQKRSLLIADYVSVPVAEALREQGQAFADTVGNAYIDEDGILIYVTHHKRPQVRPKANQVFTVGGIKLLFAMICDPDLAAKPQRQIAAAAGAALGTVPKVLADLKGEGWLLTAGTNKRLKATKGLLDQWAQAYAQRLRPKTLVATYQTPHFQNWKKWQLPKEGVWWGGEPAGNLLVGHLTPGVLTIYTNKLPPKMKVDLQLRKADELEGPQLLEIREPFWPWEGAAHGTAQTVPPALIYADLLATGNARCIETAGLVYDQHLARLLQA